MYKRQLLRRPSDFASLLADEPKIAEDHPYRALFDDDDVRRFFAGTDGNVALDADVFARYAGRSP